MPVTTPGDEHWDDVSLLIRGDTLTDLSANTHTVNEHGSTPLYNDTTTTKYASGSLMLDGDGDYISIPDDPSLEVGSGDFTVECWAYHSGALSSFSAIMGKRSLSTDKSPYQFNADASNPEKMRFLASAGTNWDVTLVDTDAFPTDQWVHVAATREGNAFTLWINGQSKATTTAAITLVNNSGPLLIGRPSETLSAGANEWNGNLEDIRITKGVARYTDTTNGFTPPTASLPTNAPVVGRRGVGTTGTAEATGTLRTRGYIGAAPAGSGGMLTLYDRFVHREPSWDGSGAEFLLVGGGGSGGKDPSGTGGIGAGGGGAGGMVVGTSQTLSTGTPYSIVIGNGGAGGTTQANGDNSTFNNLTATGGGHGGAFYAWNNVAAGASGGSGGGGSSGFNQGNRNPGGATQASYSGLTNITGHGNAGGLGVEYNSTVASAYCAGGGGGANASGSTSNPTGGVAGNGGDGLQWAVDSQYYAGGGGGAAHTTQGVLLSGGSGGSGGGGDGYRSSNANTFRSATAGTANTGGGGGGSADGGSGVFKIWVPVANYTNYVVGAELTEAASQQVTYGGTDGTLITITANSGTTTNTITFN